MEIALVKHGLEMRNPVYYLHLVLFAFPDHPYQRYLLAGS